MSWAKNLVTNPYTHPYTDKVYSFKELELEILDDKETKEFTQSFQTESPLYILEFYKNLDEIIFIQSPPVAKFITPHGIWIINDHKEFERCFTSIETVEMCLDEDKPIELLIDYPFSINVKTTIYPYQISNSNTTYNNLTVGYIFWQVALAHYKICGTNICDRNFKYNDLAYYQLGSISFYKNNKISVGLNS